METAHTSAALDSVSRQQSTLRRGVLLAIPVALAIWAGVYFFMPPLSRDVDLVSRLVFAIECCCVAALLCFLTGIEAVAHQRLGSPAIDPLAGCESRRMQIDLRYLQNTLEQLLVFIPGLLALAVYCSDACRRCRDDRVDRFADGVLARLPPGLAIPRGRPRRGGAEHVGASVCLWPVRL